METRTTFSMYRDGALFAISLRAGEQTDYGNSYPTEEGYSSDLYTFEVSPDGATLYLTHEHSGRDCDGRHSSVTNYESKTAGLKKGVVPDWKMTSGRVFDEYAVAAGY